MRPIFFFETAIETRPDANSAAPGPQKSPKMHSKSEKYRSISIHNQQRTKPKNQRFMLVKRTFLKIHHLSVCILGPIFSTWSSFEHQYTSGSIQLHLGNAVCHMSDPLPDPFFSIMIGPKTDRKIFLPQQDANKIPQDRIPGGVGNGSRRGTQNRNYQGVLFFLFFIYYFF